MKNLLTSFIYTTLALLAAAPLFGQPPAVETAQQIVKEYQQREHVPGVALTLFYRGEAFFFPFGVAHLRTRRPVDSETIFEIGSITKSFTAILYALEILSGKIQMNDPAQKYLPDLQGFKGPFSAVTLYQLANHTAGFPHSVPIKDRSSYSQAVRYLKQWNPPYPPGSRYQYSNFGFGLLGIALENATHTKYIDLLTQSLLHPLKMNSTFFEVPRPLMNSYAQGYGKNGAAAPHWPVTLVAAAGALRSNSTDMSKFLAACLNLPGTPPQIAKAIELTQQGDFKISPNKTQVMSWMKTRVGNYTIYAKNGGVFGFATFMGYIPELNTGIVIMANKLANNTPLGQKILRVLANGVINEANAERDSSLRPSTGK
jgi:beta-lactamase class C